MTQERECPQNEQSFYEDLRVSNADANEQLVQLDGLVQFENDVEEMQFCELNQQFQSVQYFSVGEEPVRKESYFVEMHIAGRKQPWIYEMLITRQRIIFVGRICLIKNNKAQSYISVPSVFRKFHSKNIGLPLLFIKFLQCQGYSKELSLILVYGLRLTIVASQAFIEKIVDTLKEAIFTYKLHENIRGENNRQIQQSYYDILSISYSYSQKSQFQRQCLSQELAFIPNTKPSFGENFNKARIKVRSIEGYPQYLVVPTKMVASLEYTIEQIKKCYSNQRLPILLYFSELWLSALFRTGKKKMENKFSISYRQSLQNFCQLNQHFSNRSSLTYKIKEVQEKLKSNFDTQSCLFTDLKQVSSYYASALKMYINGQIMLSKGKSSWISEVPLLKIFNLINELLSLAYSVAKSIMQGQSIYLEEGTFPFRFNENLYVSILSAISMVLLDPFYRTFKGVSTLFQHVFMTFHRNSKTVLGQGSGIQLAQNGNCPTAIVIFLDSVSQLLASHPTEFQFNRYFLAEVAYEVYACRCKEFIFAEQKQESSNNFPSLWECITENPRSSNNQYKFKKMSCSEFGPQCIYAEGRSLASLRFQPLLKQFEIWTEYYEKMSFLSVDSSALKQ